MKTHNLSFYIPKEKETYNPILSENSKKIKTLKIIHTYKPTLLKQNYEKWKNKIIKKGIIETKNRKKKVKK